MRRTANRRSPLEEPLQLLRSEPNYRDGRTRPSGRGPSERRNSSQRGITTSASLRTDAGSRSCVEYRSSVARTSTCLGHFAYR